MKRILIFTYYFPPCHGSAPWRAYSWAQYFKRYGLFPVIVTRHWTGNEQQWADYVTDNQSPATHEIHDDYEIYHLPSRKTALFNFLHLPNLLSRLLRPVYYLLSDVVGNFSPDVNAYKTFVDFAREYLSGHKPDYILLTCPPHNMCKLIPVISKISPAKIVADFRDIWDNFEPTPSYTPTVTQQIRNSLYKHYLRGWLRHATALSTVTPAFEKPLGKVSNAPVTIIYNGFEKDFFEKMERKPNKLFTISMIGSLYPAQPVDVLLEGLPLFLKHKADEPIVVKFFGLEARPEFVSEFANRVDARQFIFSARVSKEKAIYETLQSDVLLYPGWKGYKGIIGVKPLDYLASGNNIILAPGDGEMVDELILKTRAGLITNDPQSLCMALESYYQQWKQYGICEYNGDRQQIDFFARENQARIFTHFLLSL